MLLYFYINKQILAEYLVLHIRVYVKYLHYSLLFTVISAEDAFSHVPESKTDRGILIQQNLQVLF